MYGIPIFVEKRRRELFPLVTMERPDLVSHKNRLHVCRTKETESDCGVRVLRFPQRCS